MTIPRTIEDFEGVVYDPTSFRSESSIIIDDDDEHLDDEAASEDEVEDEVESEQDTIDTNNINGVDFSSLQGYLKSDLRAKHMTPIQDIECEILEEIFNEVHGWQIHDDEPFFKTWTKTFDMGGGNFHCTRYKRFIPGVNPCHLGYIMSHPNVRPSWDKNLKTFGFSEETYKDKDTGNDSGCRLSVVTSPLPWPMTGRYTCDWCKSWNVPVPPKEGREINNAFMSLNRSCRHPDVFNDPKIQELKGSMKGGIAMELMSGISNRPAEVNGVDGCWQTNIMMADFGGHFPPWVMKYVMSPWSMRRASAAVDVVIAKFLKDPEAMKECEAYCARTRDFVVPYNLDYSKYNCNFDDSGHGATINNNKIDDDAGHRLFTSTHNKSERLQTKDSMPHSSVDWKVATPLNKKQGFMRRSFNRLGSLIKRKSSPGMGTPRSEASTAPATPECLVS